MKIHDTAAQAYAVASEAYERGRPSYPGEAVACVVDELGVGPSTTVVDLAAGTGKLTRLLVPTGARVVAVEPVTAMRTTLVAVVPGVDVVAGTAEALPLAPESVHAVTAAQAFHWFDRGEALAEIARVLGPNGGLAMLWNQRDESVPWVARLNDLMQWRTQPIPQYVDGLDWAESVAAVDAFTPLHHRQFANPHELDVESLVDRVRSTSYIANWPEPRQATLVDQVRHLVAGFPERFTLPHHTDVFWCHRR